MLLPYNVDRPTRAVPLVTYALIGANIFVFLMSVLIANFNLNEDHIAARQAIHKTLENDPQSREMMGMFGGMSENAGGPGSSSDGPGGGEDSGDGSPQSSQDTSQMRGQIGAGNIGGGNSTVRDSKRDDEAALKKAGDIIDEPNARGVDQRVQQLFQQRALELASKHLDTPEQYQTFWQIEHAYASWVFEPHYSFLNAFSYRVNDQNALHQIFSMFTAMFMHANLEHIAGNMLFLWIFGRAAEEFLGWKIYTPIYFFAGIAATLMAHMMAVIFTPNALGIPNLGASGAIAGVLGLFAIRFFRTKVRVFYLWPWAGIVAAIAIGIVFWPLYTTLRDTTVALILAAILVLGAMFVFGRQWVWGAFRSPSAWVIGVWVVIFNLAPALIQLVRGSEGGGVSYWAHIGGFGLGTLYAFLIGGVEEGKAEYAIEDAGDALQTSPENALAHAQKILEKEPNNPRVHEIAARAHDARNNLPEAERHYNAALEGFWKTGERDAAVTLYLLATQKHPELPVRPALLLSIAGHLTQAARWNETAVVLVRLTEEFENTPEGEIALLRCAQLWMRQFSDPAEAARQLEMFLTRYPDSQFRPQAQQALAAAQRAAV